MEWDNLRFFLAVARSGSLTAASNQLKSSAATVSRRIESLEETLSITLFSHHQTGYQLTDEGKVLFENAEQVEDAVLSLEQGAMTQNTDVSGVVRLATAENFANFLLTPELPGLLATHPGIVIEMVPGIGSINLTKREADIALRMARPQQGNVVVRKLGVLGYSLYGSEAYLRNRGLSNVSGIYDEDEFIVFSEDFAHLPASQWIESVLSGRSPAMITSSLYGQLAAASAGIGLAVLPCFLGDRDSSLKRVSSPIESIEQEIWLVIHRDLRKSGKVRIVADFLTDLVHRKSSVLRGY